jgi:hypothetical protein
LIAVVIDLRPGAWPLQPDDGTRRLSFSILFDALVTFLNAFLLQRGDNELAVYAATDAGVSLLLATMDPASLAINNLSTDTAASVVNADSPLVENTDGTSSAFLDAASPLRADPRRLHRRLTATLTKLPLDAPPGMSPVPHAVSNAVALALCYCHSCCSLLPSLSARILTVFGYAHVFPGASLRDDQLLNAMFTAQKSETPLDVFSLSPGDAPDAFAQYSLTAGYHGNLPQQVQPPLGACVPHPPAPFQQAADLTGGVCRCIAVPPGLATPALGPQATAILTHAFLTDFYLDAATRQVICLPAQVTVDFRAHCAHPPEERSSCRGAINYGFACSVCLAVYCSPVTRCRVCGSKLDR